ncbi:MAG: hypothetical protein NC095_03140 [Muribaculum sp.]|nr:hypothetical protein [Muribaculum sp.]
MKNLIIRMIAALGAITILMATGPSQKDTSIELPRIPLKQDSIINAILSDIFSDVSEKGVDKSNFYTFDMTTADGNHEIRIKQESLKQLPTGEGCVGYDIFNGKTIFIFSDGHYQLPKPENSATIVFKIQKPLPAPYDPQEWHFIIKDGNYARYIYGFGWIWNKREYGKNKKQTLKIEMPKRKKE